jgi:hypothetical protein
MSSHHFDLSKSALTTTRSNPLSMSVIGGGVRAGPLEVYGPPKAPVAAPNHDKMAGRPSGALPDYGKPHQRLPSMKFSEPTYRIIKRNEAIPGRESAQDLLYAGADDLHERYGSRLGSGVRSGIVKGEGRVTLSPSEQAQVSRVEHIPHMQRASLPPAPAPAIPQWQ